MLNFRESFDGDPRLNCYADVSWFLSASLIQPPPHDIALAAHVYKNQGTVLLDSSCLQTLIHYHIQWLKGTWRVLRHL